MKPIMTHQRYKQNYLVSMEDRAYQPIKNLITLEPVESVPIEEMFMQLDITREEIFDLSLTKQHQNIFDIDALVQEVRQKRYAKIQHQCGTMQMLDVTHPVPLTDIYTDVNILERDTSQQWQNVPDLLQDFQLGANSFDRLGLGKRLQRVSGLNALARYPKLMVLGKPGAGKTTFLQWVAIQCNLGEFLSDQVPIFIRLKSFAKDTRDTEMCDDISLKDYITREFASCGILDPSVVEVLLAHGRALILLDGLDEVSEEDDDNIIQHIRRFVKKFFQNRFIITCRIATEKYRFHQENFVDVEVADFNEEHVESFVKKWFIAVTKNTYEQGEVLAKQFLEKLNQSENQQIRELAVTPLLLNLICWVFHTWGEFPSKCSQLYEQGLKILLSRWDKTRDSQQKSTIYEQLSLEHKIDLLTQLAAISFEQNSYFFEKSEIEGYISTYLRKLHLIPTKSVQLQQYSQSILKAMELQHGLIVERARGIYSFSNLNFHEYFAALAIVNSFIPEDAPRLAERMSQGSWRQVFLLASSMMQPADQFLLSLKQEIDQLLTSDQKLQQLLFWSITNTSTPRLLGQPLDFLGCKSVVFRAFYLELVLILEMIIDLEQERNLISKLFSLTSITGLDFACTRDLHRAVARIFKCAYSSDPTIYFEMEILYHLVHGRTPEIKQAFQKLKCQLPDPDVDKILFYNWWKANGQAWVQELRNVMIYYFNVGHDWQFNQQQKELLKQYYYSNRLLLECLYKSGTVSPEVQQEIEETFLLPITEIKKQKQITVC